MRNSSWLFLLPLLIHNIVVGQAPRTWGIKTGSNFSNQKFENLPVLTIGSINGQPDTAIINYGGHYNLTGFQGEVYQEWLPTSLISVLAGVGYRHRGFQGNFVYNRQTGLAESLPKGESNLNRFHNLFLNLGVKLGRPIRNKLVPYILLSNRLDCRLSFKSAFWGDDYQYFSRFEYSPVVATGIEIPLKGLYLRERLDSKAVLIQAASRLTFEIEYNPGMMNVTTESTFGVPFRGGNPVASMPISKEVYNQSFAFMIGLKL